MTQGTYTFAGITNPKTGVYSQSHGTEPDRIKLTFVAQSAAIAAGGTVTFSFDGNDVNLPNCKVDQGAFQFSEAGFTEEAVLFDRRWQWKHYEKVSLHFNELLPDNKTIRPSTVKTPQEILTFLFDAIGETDADVSLVPNAARPEIAAECRDVVDLIDEMCDALGCRLILGYGGDAVTVVPINNGDALPDDDTVARVSASWNPPEVPRYIQVRFAPTIYQSRFTTEPVGMEVSANDFEVKPIGSLSYEPTETWADYANLESFADLSAEAQVLARSTVYRWFRILDGPYTIPGYVHPVTGSLSIPNRFQILPISRFRAQRFIVGDEVQRLPAGIWGAIYIDDNNDDLLVSPNPGVNTDRDQELPLKPGSFSIDEASGILMLDQVARGLVAQQNVDPEIVIEVAHGVRNADTWELDSYFKTIEINPGGYGTVTLCAEDHRVVIGQYSSDHVLTGSSDNVAELDAKATQIVTDYTEQLTARESYVVTYNKLRHDIKPTGKIYQVTHVVGDSTGAFTIGGQHIEWDTGAKSYLEKKRTRTIDRARRIHSDNETRAVKDRHSAKAPV